MAQVVIKNASGKVIRNNSGDVLKQNFQFSKGFYRGNVSAYCRIRNASSFITRSSEWTVLGWILNDGATLPNNTTFPFISIVNANASGAGTSLVVCGISTLLEYTKNETVSIFTGPGPGTNVSGFTGGRNFVGLYWNGSNALSYYLNSATRTSWLNPSWTVDFTNVYLAIGTRFGLVSYARLLDEYVIYNRSLSSIEASYIYNAKLGNEPSSIEGLKCWLRFETAEILDFSVAQDGSDLRAGFRDLSGNLNHADVINVPAGTNQERVDYINANLIKPWP